MDNAFEMIAECRDLGNGYLNDGNLTRAEECFTLGITIYDLYSDDDCTTPGMGCVMGLADCLRAQGQHAEAEHLVRSRRLSRAA